MRAVVVVLVVVTFLAGLFLLLRPDAPEGGTRDRTFDLSVEDGEMSPSEISVTQGDSVTLLVDSNEPIELHVHGYDVEREVEPGETTRIRFEADLTGRFEIEDHDSEKELGTLQVRPG